MSGMTTTTFWFAAGDVIVSRSFAENTERKRWELARAWASAKEMRLIGTTRPQGHEQGHEGDA